MLKTKSTSEQPRKHFWLYTLELQDKRYYVGITTKKKPDIRIAQHGGWQGARWTRLHKPIHVLEKIDLGFITELEAKEIENKHTKQYMKKYGHQNVRGGAVTSPEKVHKVGIYFFDDDSYNWLLAGAMIIFLSCLLIYSTVFAN